MSIRPGSKSQAAERPELTAIDVHRSPPQRRNAICQSAAVCKTAARDGSLLTCGGHIARWTERHVASGRRKPPLCARSACRLRAQNTTGSVDLCTEMGAAAASFTYFFLDDEARMPVRAGGRMSDYWRSGVEARGRGHGRFC
jgi:hypothetical protein